MMFSNCMSRDRNGTTNRISNAGIWLGSASIAEMVLLVVVGGKPDAEFVVVGLLVWELALEKAENRNHSANDRDCFGSHREE